MQRSVLLVSLLALLAPASAGQTTLYSFPGIPTNDKFGSALGAAGDVDADGYPDFVVGSPGNDVAGENAGALFVYSGEDKSLLHSAYGSLGFFDWGTTVDGAGDVNGDGHADFVGGNAYVFVYSGLDGSVLQPLVTPGVTSVAGVGDVDSDGHGDVLVGAAQQGMPGHARLHSGFDGTQIHQWMGCGPGSNFGRSVDGAGDVDADGVPDVIVLQFTSSGCERRAYVYSGADASLLHEFEVDPNFGGQRMVAGAGDVDADGHADLIVGNSSCGGASDGRTRVYSGADGSLLHDIPGESSSAGCAAYGASVDGAGDVDGDGYDDLIVGAAGGGGPIFYADVRSGRFGDPLYRVTSTETDFGYAAVGLGDLDQDGRLDFGVGALLGSVTVYSACAGTFARYGDACPGASGASPELWGWGCAMAGESVNVTLSKGPPGAPGFLAMGAMQASIPLAGSCSLLVAPLASVISTGALATAGPGIGKVTLALGVPSTAAGAVATLQGFVVDMGVPHLFAASNGVEIQVP